MKCLLLLCLAPVVLGILQFRERGYIRFPDSAGRIQMLKDGATKARYHRQSRMLYVVGNSTQMLHIVQLTNPDAPAIVYSKHFNTIGDGHLTDVAVCDDTIAVSIASNDIVSEGHVELYQPYSTLDPIFTLIGRMTVGPYPKDMAFTPDCSRLVVANEGRPGMTNSEFTDPEGSITIILRNDQGFPVMTNIPLTTFNSNIGAYLNAGVRYIFRGEASAGIQGSFSKDLEPESVTIDNTGNFAYVAMQENNAILKINLATNSLIDLYGMGVKNWTSFDMDPTDRDGGPNLRRHQIYSFYQPRDIKFGELSGTGYIISANTGAKKQFYPNLHGFSFRDYDSARTLNNGGFIDRAEIGQELLANISTDTILGRLWLGNQDGKNLFQLIQYPHAFGGRSISMWNALTFQRVYDTGDDLERESRNSYQNVFNGDCYNLNASPFQEADMRSYQYGAEPTSLDLGTFANSPIMVTGTRSGMIYVFRLTGTAMSYQSVHRRGSTSQTWNTLSSSNSTGDTLISDIGYLDEFSSPDGKALVYVVGSGSSSVGLYEIYDDGITKK